MLEVEKEETESTDFSLHCLFKWKQLKQWKPQMLFSNYSSDCLQYARWSLCVCSCVRVSVCVSGWVVVVFTGCIIGALLFSTCLCSLLWNMKPNHYWTSELTAGHTHTHHQLICVYCLSFKKCELTQTHEQQKCQYEFLTQSFFILLVHL